MRLVLLLLFVKLLDSPNVVFGTPQKGCEERYMSPCQLVLTADTSRLPYKRRIEYPYLPQGFGFRSSASSPDPGLSAQFPHSRCNPGSQSPKSPYGAVRQVHCAAARPQPNVSFNIPHNRPTLEPSACPPPSRQKLNSHQPKSPPPLQNHSHR